MSWIEEARSRSTVEDVADAMGLSVWSKGGARGFPCPEHPEAHADGRPTGRIVRGGSAFFCHKCGSGGDVVALVSLCMFGERAVRGDSFHAVRSWFADRGWCSAYGGGGGRRGARMAPTKAPERKEEPPPSRTPSEELAAFWGSCGPVEADGPVGRWLAARNISGEAVRTFDLVRSIPSKVDAPDWAGFQWTDRETGEEVRRPWGRAGWRLGLPCFDADGAMVAVRARWTGTRPAPGGGWEQTPPPFSGKEVSPRGAGFCKGTVYACPVGRWLLRGRRGRIDEGAPALRWSGKVWVFEGGPAFLRFATAPDRVTSDGQVDAMVGVWSGAWTAGREGLALARRCKGAQGVMVATDDDPGGDRIARPIGRALNQVGVNVRTIDWTKVNHG